MKWILDMLWAGVLEMMGNFLSGLLWLFDKSWPLIIGVIQSVLDPLFNALGLSPVVPEPVLKLVFSVGSMIDVIMPISVFRIGFAFVAGMFFLWLASVFALLVLRFGAWCLEMVSALIPTGG